MTTSVGLFLSALGWFPFPNASDIKPWVVGAGFVAILVSCFRIWKDEATAKQNLVERVRGFPRLVLAAPSLEEFKAHSVFGGIHGPEYSAIKLNLENDPIVPSRESIGEQISAHITLRDSQGAVLCRINGRWADSTQPAHRNPAADIMEIRAVAFPPGQMRSLDIAMKYPDDELSYAFANESFGFPPLLKNPQWRLPIGTILGDIRITGIQIRISVNLQFANDGIGQPLRPLGCEIRNELHDFHASNSASSQT
jgi:hypothetical protein